MHPRQPIIDVMRKKNLPNPYEIQKSDIGRLIDWHGFGTVKEFDVGKRVYLRDRILQMENTEQMEKRKGKGWHGDTPGHRKAALKAERKGAIDEPIEVEDDDLPEAWMKKAKRELEKKLGVKTKVASDSYYEDLGGFALESVEGEANNGEREWIVFPDSETAEKAAVQRVRDDLEDEPEIYVQSWLQNFVEISDTNRRIIAGEESDNLVDEVYDEKDIIREADIESDIEEIDEKIAETEDIDKLTELEKEKEKLIDDAKEKVREDKYEEIYKALEDPIEYFVEEQGIYSREDLLKQSFIRIDVEKAAQDAVDTDGAGHFLDGYDGAEVDLPSGAVAYGTN